MSKKRKVSKILVFIAIFLCISISLNSVYAADYVAGESKALKQDEQFKERIKILKQVIGENKINEVALAATVLSKETAFDAVGSRYKDSDNWKSDYESSMRTFFGGGKVGGETDKKETISDNSGITKDNLDLLTAAAIIMADSSNSGSYSEKKYKEALAGDTFINNNKVLNTIFCSTSGVVNGVINIGNTAYTVATGDEASKDQTWYNRQRICDNGYVGGIYNITKETEPDDELRKAKKERVAQEIIDFIHYYCKLTGSDACQEDTSSSCSVTTTGDFANWKQYKGDWASLKVGNGGTMSNIGCFVTSMAIQIARSGTQIQNLPSGYDSFDPGAFVTELNGNGGFIGGGLYTRTGHQNIAPNWNVGALQNDVSVGISNNTSALAQKLSQELSTGAEGKYQKFLILYITTNKYDGHFVAVDSVSDDNVTIFDPGGEGTTLDENYSSWTVMSYSVSYATDVEIGKTGSSTASGDNCAPSGIQQIMEFIRKNEGFEYCNYQGRGEETGFDAHIDSADMVYSGFTTGYGITQTNNLDLAEEVGYTTFEADGLSGCTDRTYIDKMAEVAMTREYELVKSSYEEKSGGRVLQEYQYHAFIYLYRHAPTLFYAVLNDIANVDPTSYEVYESFLVHNGLGGSCGGLNGHELMYHLFYNGDYNAVRDYPCAQISRDYWEQRKQFYDSEKGN